MLGPTLAFNIHPMGITNVGPMQAKVHLNVGSLLQFSYIVCPLTLIIPCNFKSEGDGRKDNKSPDRGKLEKTKKNNKDNKGWHDCAYCCKAFWAS